MQTHPPTDSFHADPSPSTPRTVKAVEPVDLVSYIQHTLGYAPSNSLTVITLSGHSLGAVLRCDWHPDRAGAWDEVCRYAQQVVDYLAADERADGTLAFLFRDSTARPGPDADTDGLLAAALEIELRDAGMPLQETWLVTDGRLWHLDCPDVRTCTGHGTEVARTETSALNAALILEGSVIREQPRDSGLPACAEQMSPELAAALDRLAGPGPAREGWLCWLRDWERILAGQALPPEAVTRAALVAGLTDVHRRDTLVAAASFTLERAVSGAAWLHVLPRTVAESLGTGPLEVNAVLYSSVLMATSRRAPDWERIARLGSACELLLPEAFGTAASALRCVVAWIEWARGRGSAAGRIIEECRRADPHYPLAQVLGEVVDRGILSGWAARRATAWSARGRDGL